MMEQVHAGNRLLLGGRVCLDFCNTIDARDSSEPVEWLHSYVDLVRWSLHAGTLVSGDSEPLLRLAEARPEKASHVLDEAIRLRETMYRIFRAVVDGHNIAAEELQEFNRFHRDALVHLILIRGNDGFGWQWANTRQLEYVLWPVARSASELMTASELDRVRQCPGCGWLFLDQSRNRSRTWCDMQFCGNRAKARRYYERRNPVGKAKSGV